MQQRALTRAARPHDNDKGSFSDIQRHAGQRRDIVFTLAINFADVDAADHAAATLANEMNGGRAQCKRGVLLIGFKFRQVSFHRFGKRRDVDAEKYRTERVDLREPGAPKFNRTYRNALLQFEISRGDLDDPLIELAGFAVIFQPDFFERLMALEEKPLIEFFNTFQKSGIVLGFHPRTF